MMTLDIDLIRAFVQVADTGSFTMAGEAVGASQSAMSVRIRKLEERLGNDLLARSPRSVQLTSYGARFLKDARHLLDLHDRVAAKATGIEHRQVLRLGISDHAAGSRLPDLLSNLSKDLVGYRFLVTAGLSGELLKAYQARLFDAVIASAEDPDLPARTVFRDDLVWIASRTFAWEQSMPMPLVFLGGACVISGHATRTLKDAGIAWNEVFSGTGVSAVQAAVSAGIGIACLNRRNMPRDCIEVGETYGLPPLPKTRMALFHRLTAPEDAGLASAIVRAFQLLGGEEGAPDRDPELEARLMTS